MKPLCRTLFLLGLLSFQSLVAEAKQGKCLQYEPVEITVTGQIKKGETSEKYWVLQRKKRF